MILLLLKTLHIIFAGIWLVNFLSDFIFRKNIDAVKGSESEKKLISLYMKYVNLLGIIGSVGILTTGIIMVLLNPGYNFFQFTANHWLTTKQIIMVVILIIIFARVIPTAKKLRGLLKLEISEPEPLNEDAYSNLKKLYSVNFQTNLLVLLNILLAITRYFYS